MDGGKLFVQRDQSAAHLVLLGYLLRFRDFKRHGTELHRVLCALLHRIRLDCLYSAVYHADGLFRLHARQTSDPQTF